MKSILSEFRKFLMQGDLVNLAVAVVIGVVFAAVIKALIADLITPIIALIFGQPNFSNLSFTANSSHFLYGDFINALLTFVMTAAAVFFLVVKPYNVWQERKPADPSVKECPQCTSEIPIKARRCPLCTTQLEPAGAAGMSATS
jgi:large conductance mechanosensitive channel